MFRDYQQEADAAIYEELVVNTASKCIVKMFCGTGKSRLMRYCQIIDGRALVVYVVPSLGLIRQFYTEYLADVPPDNVLKICSEDKTTTTDPAQIRQFLQRTEHKIVCITYYYFG